MGLYEQILDRSRPAWTPPAEDAAFPELTPTPPAEDESWLSKIPQTMLPPHLRKKKGEELPAVDASAPAIQRPLIMQPGLGAGMIDPAFPGGGDQSPFLNPVQKTMQASVGGDQGSAVPLPVPAPPGAKQWTPEGPPAPAAAPLSLKPPIMARAQADDEEEAAPAAAKSPSPAPSPFEIPSILDKIKTGLGGIKDTLGNNSNTLIALGAGLAGAPTVGIGLSRAGQAALPARAADIQQTLQQQGRATGTKALVDAGVPVQQAIAAQTDPELKKALIQNYIVDRKHELKTIKDWQGNETMVDYDPFTGKTKRVDVSNGTGTGNVGGADMTAAGHLEPNYDPVTHRDEAYLAAVRKADPLTAAAIEDIAAGKLPATGRNMQKLMPLVARYEQGFENNRYTARQALEKSYYGGGEGAKALRSANTTIDHGMKLEKAIDDLHNFSVLPDVSNRVTGVIAEQSGNKKYQDALARFNATAAVYAKELEFALTGKNTVSGTKKLQEMFDPYASPTKNKAAMQQTLEMLKERVGEHENTYRTGMNKPAHDFSDMLSKRHDLERLLGNDTGAGVSANGPVAPAAPGAAPKPGKYVFQNGSLVPVQ